MYTCMHGAYVTDTGGVDDRKGYLNNLCKTLQWKNEQTLKEDNHNQEYANENAHSHTDVCVLG